MPNNYTEKDAAAHPPVHPGHTPEELTNMPWYKRGGAAAADEPTPKKKPMSGSAITDEWYKETPSADPSNFGQHPGYKKGGTVSKTGLAIVHKGEYVVPAKKAKVMSKQAAFHE